MQYNDFINFLKTLCAKSGNQIKPKKYLYSIDYWHINSCHFGNNLISYILYQYHHQHVTQPLLLKQLQDLGVDISSGRLSQFITDGLDVFHDEKDQLLLDEIGIFPFRSAPL